MCENRPPGAVTSAQILTRIDALMIPGPKGYAWVRRILREVRSELHRVAAGDEIASIVTSESIM